MMLLDGNMGEIKLTGTQKGNLARSWILTAGAFQDIFKEKMGASVDFVEQVAEAKITREEMESLSGLPTELLNRVGHVIHVASPTPLELALAYEEIETATGHKAAKKSRDDAAREAVIAMKGFRGLEEYALTCAREVLLKNAKGAK